MSTDPTTPPWEPPLAGTDADHLLGMLDRLRWTFRWKASGLDEAGLAVSVGASSLTLGGLLKHLAAVETLQFTWKAFHTDPGPPWNAADWESTPDWDLRTAAEHSAAELYAMYDEAVAASRARLRAAVDAGGLDQLTEADGGDGNHPSLRRLVCDLVEEYGRHTGHADLLREAVDGLVGEDPPDDWRL